MSLRATERRNGKGSTQSGSALVTALAAAVGLFGLIFATTLVSIGEVRDSRRSFEELRARGLAEAGIEYGALFLADAQRRANAFAPLWGLQQLFAVDATIFPHVGQPLSANGAQVGAFSVSLTMVESTTNSITIRIDSTGYLPDAPVNLPAGRRVEAWDAVSTTLRYDLAPSQVFDYGYFINNWGWFYGNTIYCYGNARSNGQFDAAGYKPTVTGQPLYDSVENNGGTVTLSGYQDDNLDGLADGNDGGIFSGWDIVGAQNVQGNGGNASNQHDYDRQIEMPNLSDLTQHEEAAIAAGSGISIGGSVVSNGVYGDEPGEHQNLYLVGTAANPIEIKGKVVVRGDVIIKGYVTGQGAIYSGGNVYVPDSVKYVDPPNTPRPANNTQSATESWLEDNWDKDFLGLFSAENVVVGDHTNSTWRKYVSGWLASSLNKSEEDAGEDGIPNTSVGRDGIASTSDDDLLEDDGIFTTETYTQADYDLGIIPPGYSIGDVVPGSGEDIDGDGQYDDTVSLLDIDLKSSLDTSNWGGNMPLAGISNYKDISTLYANQLDAVFYTNHAFCWVVLGGSDAVINGALVSRNESVVYGTPSLKVNHDSRLLGGANGMAGDLLPRAIQPPVVVRWKRLTEDPLRYLEAP